MKRYADMKRRPYTFKEGQLVLLKLQPYWQHSIERCKYQKLGKKWYGPYKIIKKVSEVAMRLELPVGSTIFPVFHALLLKPFRGEKEGELGLELPPMAQDAHPITTPDKVWDCRYIKKQGTRIKQLLVSWAGMPLEETS